MAGKPTYEELELRVKELEEEAVTRKQAEEALRDSEKKYRTLVHEIKDGLFITDIKGTTTFANQALAKMLGYENPEKMLGKPFLEFLPSEVRDEIMEKFIRAIRDRNFLELVEFPALRKDGSIIFVQLKHAPVIEQGRIVGTRGVIRDITERKRAEDTLRESEEKYRLHFENVSDVIFSIDPDFKVINISPSVERVLGYKPDELIGKSFQDLNVLAPDYLEQAFSNTMRVLAGERINSSEYEFIAKDGTRKFGEVSGASLVRGGKIIAVVAIARDITDRKRTEEALHKSEEKYRLLVETMNEGLWIQNEDGIITYTNERLCNMINYSNDEVIGRPLTDFLEENHRDTFEEYKPKRKNDSLASHELILVAKDGQKILTLASPRSIFNEEGQYKGIFAVLTDITHLKQTEKELEQKAKHLEKTNTALEVLLEHRDEERRKLAENIMANVKKLILPYIDKMEGTKTVHENKTYLHIIKSNLTELISPFANTLSSKYYNFTPTEIKIADLIKQGKTSKEVASLLNISHDTVSFHRYNIRKKLGLLNKKVNLRTHLESLSS